MTPEQLQAAYDKGYAAAMESTPQHGPVLPNRWEVAGLAEVARQQAERDAQIARDRAKIWNDQSERTEDSMSATSWDMSRAADYVADAIRAQFPEETGR